MAVLAAAALLLHATRARLAFTTIALALGGWHFLAPRWDCSWQIQFLRLQSLSLSGLSALDIDMDVGVRVWVRPLCD